MLWSVGWKLTHEVRAELWLDPGPRSPATWLQPHPALPASVLWCLFLAPAPLPATPDATETAALASPALLARSVESQFQPQGEAEQPWLALPLPLEWWLHFLFPDALRASGRQELSLKHLF